MASHPSTTGKPRIHGKWALFSVLAVIAGIAAAALGPRLHRAPPPAAPAAAAVLAPRNQITLSGSVRAQHVVPVGASVEGNINAFMADVGDEVFEGQVLARIGSAGLETAREQAAAEVDTAQGQVTRAEASVNAARLEASRADADAQRARLQMEQAQKIFDRQTTLHNAGATPRLTYEKARAEFDAAQHEFEVMDNAARAARESLQGTLDRLEAVKKTLAEKTDGLDQAHAAFASAEVRAPVSGTIVARQGEVGKPAEEAGDHMFQIATDLYALEVAVDVPPAAVKRIRPGQEALVLLLDLANAGMQGTVKEVEDNQAIVEFAGTVPGIKPGMRADVRLKLE